MEYTVEELARKRANNEAFLLLDVRTAKELEIVSLAGAKHIPLHELEASIGTLSAWKDKEVICMCHHGGRSAMAQRILLKNGFTDVKNLAGGIHAYAEEVDTSLAIYE
ncbi:MAG: sulfurtransferase [Candidatus Hydrogenedentes bacterium]|nr:sulfurtransferase [Candidatus Hydrogenedentota bacterium]